MSCQPPGQITISIWFILNKKLPHDFIVWLRVLRRIIGLPDVLVVELVAALRAEFGRMLGVFRLPAALVTAVQRLGRGLLRAAFGAELALVDCAAGADPAVGGLGSAALHTEFAPYSPRRRSISKCLHRPRVQRGRQERKQRAAADPSGTGKQR